MFRAASASGWPAAVVGRHERVSPVGTDSEPQDPPGEADPLGLVVGVGGQRTDTEDQVRLVEHGRGLEVIEVQLGRDVGRTGVEVVGVGEREPEHAGELGAEPGRAQQRDHRGRAQHRRRPEAGPHPVLAPPVAEHAHDVDEVAGELLDTLLRCSAER